MITIVNQNVSGIENTDMNTIEGCDACLQRLHLFRKRKKNTAFDSFTHSDLDFFEKCVLERRNELKGMC